jgi:hypothetical protein
MGIRVHKDLGYGLTDVKTKDFDIIDPRINPSFNDDLSRDDFLSFLASRPPTPDMPFFQIASTAMMVKDSKFWEPRNSVVQDSEFGLPGVLLIIPPGFTDSWRRHDHMIDWVEETMTADGSKSQLNHVRELPRPLYPFDSWMDARTGLVLPDSARQYIEIRAFANEAGPKKHSIDLDAVAANAGFADAREADTMIVPNVPHAVRLLAEFLGIFTDNKTSLSLKPLLYTWWG